MRIRAPDVLADNGFLLAGRARRSGIPQRTLSSAVTGVAAGYNRGVTRSTEKVNAAGAPESYRYGSSRSGP